MGPSGALVELSGVGRRYSVGSNEVVALADVSLRVAAEDLVVVLGPSGSGKTTLLNIIGALDSPSEGRVVVAGQDITRASRKELFAFRRHGVSFVFQTFNLFPALTALENVEFGADAAGQDHVREVARCWIASGSPSERLTSPTSCWAASSNGSDRAPLASGNPILLADEPTGELDFQTGIQILERLHAQAIPGVRCSSSRTTGRSRASPTGWSSSTPVTSCATALRRAGSSRSRICGGES